MASQLGRRSPWMTGIGAMPNLGWVRQRSPGIRGSGICCDYSIWKKSSIITTSSGSGGLQKCRGDRDFKGRKSSLRNTAQTFLA